MAKMPKYGEVVKGKDGVYRRWLGRGRWEIVNQGIPPGVLIDECPPPGLEGVRLSRTPPPTMQVRLFDSDGEFVTFVEASGDALEAKRNVALHIESLGKERD